MKPALQQRIESESVLSGKTPRLFLSEETHQGLKYGLSGNPASLMATQRNES